MRWLFNFVFGMLRGFIHSAPSRIWRLITFDGYPPRKKWAWLILGLIVGGGITFYLTFPASEGLRLLSEGVEIRGRVLNKYVRESTNDNGDTHYEYNVSYEFDAGLGDPTNMRYDTSIVNEDTYNRSILHEQITVRFIYDAPRINSVQPNIDYRNHLNRLILAFAAYGVLLLVVALNAIQVILRAVYRGKTTS